MTAVNSTPAAGYLASADGTGAKAVAAGASYTATFQITGNWEVQIPCGAFYRSAVSLPTLISVFPSSDDLNFDTAPIVMYAIPAVVSVSQVYSVRLTTGLYLVALTTSSPSVSIFFGTQKYIDKVINQ